MPTIGVTLLSAGIGFATGLVGSFVGYFIWPFLRGRWIRRNLHLVAEPLADKKGLWCRVANRSHFAAGKALAYISIHHELTDKIEPPANRLAFTTPSDGFYLRQAPLAWAILEGGQAQVRADICPGEEPPIVLGFLAADHIEVVSELGREPARVFLVRKVYEGELKVACMDCPARTFRFRIDPANLTQPIRLLT